MCADGHKKRLFMRRYASALGRLSEWTVSGICAIIPSMHYRMAVAASGFSGRSNGEYVMYALVKLVRRFTSDRQAVTAVEYLSLIHISEPTRRTPISYAVFCL